VTASYAVSGTSPVASVEEDRKSRRTRYRPTSSPATPRLRTTRASDRRGSASQPLPWVGSNQCDSLS
jgi:hypothetical protein